MRRAPTNAHFDAADFCGAAGYPTSAVHGTEGAGTSNIRHAASEFLASLFSGKPAESHILIWRMRGKESHWFTDLNEGAALVERLQNEDAYVAVALSPKDFGSTRRCKAEDSVAIAGFWIDLDIVSKAHKKTNLPRSIADALSLLPSVLPPSLVVHTGHGVQCWWILRELWIFRDGCDRTYAQDLAAFDPANSHDSWS